MHLKVGHIQSPMVCCSSGSHTRGGQLCLWTNYLLDLSQQISHSVFSHSIVYFYRMYCEILTRVDCYGSLLQQQLQCNVPIFSAV